MITQKIITSDNDFAAVDAWLLENYVSRPLLVCGSSIRHYRIHDYFCALPQRLGVEPLCFSDFQPNPLYASVEAGTAQFRAAGCDAIIAVGGGSAMDVAKCIKLYSGMDPTQLYLHQPIVPNAIPFLAMPTTAGTGSEATRFAVIYYDGAKQSVSDPSCIPGTVLMDSSVLKTLPLYHKKSTMMDALCHALESFWSVNSTETSRAFSQQAITEILANRYGYLNNEDAGSAAMLRAAHLAGKAINIAQTTAGHAMCYKLTSLYHIAHGHAAALCNAKLIPYMLEHLDRCVDARGEAYLADVLRQIAQAMGCATEALPDRFAGILEDLALLPPEAAEADYAVLTTSVNPERLRNHPVRLDAQSISDLYHQILGQQGVLPNES